MSGFKPSGRHQTQRLTAATIRNLPAPGFYGDGHGLYLKVDRSGAKRWIQRIKIGERRRDVGLGAFSLVSLAEAREMAIQNRKLARSGGDPLAAKKLCQGILTFEGAARKVHELRKLTWRNGKHSDQWLTTLEVHAFPTIGTKRADTIGSSDLMAVLMPIWTRIPETGIRVLQRMTTILDWAVAQGWRGDNPAKAIRAALPKHDRSKIQHRMALPHCEVAFAMRKIEASKALEATKLACAFLIHTCARLNEALSATWSEIDLTAGVWTVPAARMKGKKVHRVPLTAMTIAILDKAKALRQTDCDLLFPSMKGKPLSGNTLSKLMRDLGIAAVPHGFRTSFKNWATETTNHSYQASELALAHWPKDKAEAAYARSDLLELRKKLMTDWDAYIAAK